jgi:LmbE family N-acetylglucosaminyl deacetylase
VEAFHFVGAGGRAPLILFLGAHCDDIEIGCGGTVLRFRQERPDAELRWVILSSDPARADEARESATRFLGEEGAAKVVVEDFRDGFLPYHGLQVKEVFERLKTEMAPDLIFTHTRDDLHQDHRLVCELTWNTWRNHSILEYEIPKWDGDLGRPNCYVPLPEAIVEQKVKTLMEVYSSQLPKAWFDEDTLKGLMRLRGMECNAAGRHAEAFIARKFALGLHGPPLE